MIVQNESYIKTFLIEYYYMVNKLKIRAERIKKSIKFG
jgi:hypothetical protein